MLFIVHEILFSFENGDLAVLNPPVPTRLVFSNHQHLENQNLVLKTHKFMHQSGNFILRNTFLEFAPLSIPAR